MSYGFEVLNNAGRFLIDGVFPNYSLLASGTVAAGTTVNFSTAASRPLVFVRFNTSNYYVRVSSLTNSSVVFQIWNSPASGATDATQVAGNVEYMIFGVANSLSPSGGYGMHVFNGSGTLVYDSNRLYPRIREVVTVSALTIFTDSNRHPTGAANHNMGTSPWMLANSTLNCYGFNFIQETPQPTSDLMATSIRSDTASGNRILVQAVRMGITIGSQGSAWSSAQTQVALIP